MLMDIFSSFDEQNGNFFSLSLPVWLVGVFFTSCFLYVYWWNNGRWGVLGDVLSSFMWDQVSRGRGANLCGFGGFVSSLMVFLLVMNLSGLLPYVFSNTSHLIVTFGLASVLWLSLIVSSVFYNFGSFVAVLLPAGAPSVLNPFLVLVETVSLIVRPVTLSVRLAANMGAGHIVLSLLGSYLSAGIFVYSFYVVVSMVFIDVFYFLFEVGICLIQSYIFFLLLNLYADEHV
uniref:ATP synthase subunit a n=1 Tax=Quasilineus sinicus TaxID=2859485 RepID=A0A8F5P380_9BILA|nr:ATP synthase F0 subunit 6 [Quasilineus sinicus]QXO02047.1 ATP synthase F0 subunit 6 [Quasilineus sinicus]